MRRPGDLMISHKTLKKLYNCSPKRVDLHRRQFCQNMIVTWSLSVKLHSGETLRETSRYNPRPAELVARIAELEARLSEKDSLIAAHERAIDDLRRRLDAEAEERRRLTAILTDQRAAVPDSVLRPSPWWRRRFGRRR
jgi:hypothetical protein